jgi:single-strand DNA-binding protein
MSNETYVTLIGNIVREDPDLRFTPSGAGVAKFTVVTNARKFNKQTNQWEKRPGKFWRCEAWNQGEKNTLGENVAEGLKKGDSVIVYGELETQEYEKDGEKRSADVVKVETIGKDLRWHSAPAATSAPAAEEWGNFAQQSSGAPF